MGRARTEAREKRRPKDQSERATPERKPANTNSERGSVVYSMLKPLLLLGDAQRGTWNG